MATTTIPPSHGVSSGLQNKVHEKHQKNSEYRPTSRCNKSCDDIFQESAFVTHSEPLHDTEKKSKTTSKKHKWKSNIDKAPWEVHWWAHAGYPHHKDMTLSMNNHQQSYTFFNRNQNTRHCKCEPSQTEIPLCSLNSNNLQETADFGVWTDILFIKCCNKN